jgi:ATP-dependent DNA ligase
VIRGYTPGPHGLDSVIVGFYRGDDLVYVARTRNGFVPASRRRLFEKLRPLVKPDCPFVNLPETVGLEVPSQRPWGARTAYVQGPGNSLRSKSQWCLALETGDCGCFCIVDIENGQQLGHLQDIVEFSA